MSTDAIVAGPMGASFVVDSTTVQTIVSDVFLELQGTVTAAASASYPNSAGTDIVRLAPRVVTY